MDAAIKKYSLCADRDAFQFRKVHELPSKGAVMDPGIRCEMFSTDCMLNKINLGRCAEDATSNNYLFDAQRYHYIYHVSKKKCKELDTTGNAIYLPLPWVEYSMRHMLVHLHGSSCCSGTELNERCGVFHAPEDYMDNNFNTNWTKFKKLPPVS
jgi:hypothetical protein